MQATSPYRQEAKIGGRLAEAFARLASEAERFAPYLAAATLIGILALAMFKALYRAFWYDELFSVYIAKLPHLTDIWSICKTGVDLQPPPYYYLLRMSIDIFGSDEWGVRVPSAAGYVLFCLSLYWFVSRRTSKLYGLTALLFPGITGCWYYATNGRPYALALACAGLAAVSWQSVVLNRHRATAVAGLGFWLAAAICMHYYSVFLLVIFGIAEGVRALRTRKVDWPVWIALTAPLLVLVPFASVMREGRASAGALGVVLAVPRWYLSLVDFANHFIGPTTDEPGLDPRGAVIGLIAAACIYLVFRVFESRPLVTAPQPRDSISREWLPEVTLICAITFFLPLMEIATGKFVTHVLFPRYLIASMFGVTALLGFVMWLAFHGRKEPALAVAVVFAGLFGVTALFDVTDANEIRHHPISQSVRNRIPPVARRDELPIVLADTSFLQLSYYADPSLAKRIWYISDPESPMRVHGGERSIVASAPYFGTHVIDYKTFIRSNPTFYFLGVPGWLVSRWNEEGAGLKLLQGGLMDTSWRSSEFFLKIDLRYSR